MKLSDAITDYKDTGICGIDVDKVCKCFRLSTISRWHDQYRLVNLRAKVKVTISKEDAEAIIQKLNLVDVKSGIFANASTFMTQARIDHYYGAKE